MPVQTGKQKASKNSMLKRAIANRRCCFSASAEVSDVTSDLHEGTVNRTSIDRSDRAGVCCMYVPTRYVQINKGIASANESLMRG